MTLFELLAISQDIASRIDVQWGFFITVHMALFGGIVYVDRPLKVPEKWVAMFLYLGFSLVNYTQLHNLVSMLSMSYMDIIAMAENHPDLSFLDQFKRFGPNSAYRHVGLIVACVHVVMAIIVLCSIVFDIKDKDGATDQA